MCPADTLAIILSVFVIFQLGAYYALLAFLFYLGLILISTTK